MPRRRRRRNRRSPRWSSVRVTRTKGSGASQTTSYRTGGISITGLESYGESPVPVSLSGRLCGIRGELVRAT